MTNFFIGLNGLRINFVLNKFLNKFVKINTTLAGYTTIEIPG